MAAMTGCGVFCPMAKMPTPDSSRLIQQKIDRALHCFVFVHLFIKTSPLFFGHCMVCPGRGKNPTGDFSQKI